MTKASDDLADALYDKWVDEPFRSVRMSFREVAREAAKQALLAEADWVTEHGIPMTAKATTRWTSDAGIRARAEQIGKDSE